MKIPSDSRLVAIRTQDKKFFNTLRIEWFLGMKCNLSCSYCAEHENKSEFASKNEIFTGIDNLSKKLNNKKHFLLLGGGEPSLHPDIIEICQYFAQKKIYLGMITNGTQKPELYIGLLQYIKDFTFSIHFETTAYKKTIETILQVDKSIKESGIDAWDINVHLILSSGNFDKAKTAKELLDKNNIKYIYRKVRSSQPFTPEEESFFQEKLFSTNNNTLEFWETPSGQIIKLESNPNDILSRDLHHFKDWKCYVGLDRLHIYANGDVFRSTCHVGGKLGNIYDDFTIPSEPIKCYNPKCTCAWAVDLTKVAEDKYLKLIK